MARTTKPASNEPHVRSASAVRVARGARAAEAATTFDPDKLTFEFVLASETPCRTYRYDGWDRFEVDEVLRMSGCDLSEFEFAPICDTHHLWSSTDVVGVVEGSSIEGKNLVCKGKLSPSDDVADVAAKVGAGILRKFSVGFKIIEEELDESTTPPTVNVIRWKPLEASIVPIPADPTAQIRGAKTMATAPKKPSVTDVLAQLEAMRASIDALTTRAKKSGEEDVDSEGDEGSEGSEGSEDTETADAGDDEDKKAAKAKKAKRSAERTRAIESLRGVAKRNGFVDDFNDLAGAGATIEELRSIAVGRMRTSNSPVATTTFKGGISGGSETETQRSQATGFANSAIARRAAKVLDHFRGAATHSDAE